jgi:hypothetical protein
MPRGSRGEKRPADVIGRSVKLLIGLEGLQIEPPLVAEGVVEALPADPHRGDQVFGGGRCEPFRPEHLHRAVQGRIAIEFPRPDHDEATAWNILIAVLSREISIDRI